MVECSGRNCWSDRQGRSSLRGFRKRWAQNASARSEGDFSHITDMSEFQKIHDDELPLPELDGPSDGESVDYAPTTEYGTSHAPQILDREGVDPGWEASRVSYYEEVQDGRCKTTLGASGFEWSISTIECISSGSIVDGCNRALMPTHIGLHDVFNSGVISVRSDRVGDFIRSDPTWTISLKRARKELPEEDIRRMALQKHQSILLADSGASCLGCGV